MKLDCLSPTQWTAILSIFDAESKLARRMAKGLLFCGNCERRLHLTPADVKYFFDVGWPVCCPNTLKGGTMSYYRNEDQLRKEAGK